MRQPKSLKRLTNRVFISCETWENIKFPRFCIFNIQNFVIRFFCIIFVYVKIGMDYGMENN